jgi:hypothetical protein
MLSRPRGNGHTTVAVAAQHDGPGEYEAPKARTAPAAKAGKSTGNRKTASSRAKK